VRIVEGALDEGVHRYANSSLCTRFAIHVIYT
jgi:hypothetical protein